jgi:NitT/TauT family transport system substrate-binding protein
MSGDPSVQSMAQLRGRALGVSSLSGTTFNLARAALQISGLERGTDVALLPLGGSPQRFAALMSGQVPAVLLDLAFVPQAQRQGARVLLPLPELLELPVGGLATTDARLRNQAGQVEAMVRASLRGTRFMRDNRPDTIAIMASHLEVSLEDAAALYDLSIAAYSPTGVIADSGLQTMIDAAQEATGRGGQVTPAQVADFSFVRRIAQNP